MDVYIDQIDCTGSGQCELLVPEVFVVLDDGLATVRNGQGVPLADGGAGAGVVVPVALESRVRDAADVCPGGCIHCGA